MRVVSYGPEQRVYVPALRAGWLTQTFVHWAVPPDRIQRLLPDGLVVDTYDGTAWVSLTPFVMTGVRPLGLPASVSLPSFPETNLRTYVRRPDGRDGLWFLSLEVGCPAMVAVRAVGAPYHVGRLDVAQREGVVTYTGSRWGAGPAYRLTVRPGDPVRPNPRDVWLTSRWRAFTRRFGVIWETPVEHEPWPLRAVSVDFLQETLTRAVGLAPPGTEPLAHFSDGVRQVRLGGSRPVQRAHDPEGRLRSRSPTAR
ncbi:DUF2071 domain-containing protein [Streptomyces sp. NPDC007905]|uniref:YqjF family protein n=1 Tax=Streptomyces sp. NPDC007905 TaxID=3364788 RepID=UPI0036E019B9